MNTFNKPQLKLNTVLNKNVEGNCITQYLSIYTVGINFATQPSFKTKKQVTQACQWAMAPLQAMVHPMAKRPKLKYDFHK